MPHLDRPRGRVWWEAAGSGSPLLIIQGLGYSSDASWRLLPGLCARHTVIQLDNLGVGRSDVPEGNIEVADLAADAVAVIEEAGLGPVHLVGFSMGGLIALEVILNRPDLVRTLVLGCTSPGGPAAVPFTPEVAVHLAQLAMLPAREAAEKSAPIVYAATTAVSEIVADIDVRMARPTERAGYLAQLMAIGRYPGAQPRLGEIERPVLILHGDADLLVPPANATVLADLINGSRVHIVRGAGHIFTTDATEESVRAIVDFVDGAPAQAPAAPARFQP